MGKGPTIDGLYYEEFGNFYNSPFEVNGTTFSCTEQFYQYKKCVNNPELQNKILQETSPKKMLSIGQKCILPTNWEFIKEKVMNEANIHKFEQNKELVYKLINTGNANIIFNEKGQNDYWDLTNQTILETIRAKLKNC
jgi:ribA/ribD-fused uncharacterized protein